MSGAKVGKQELIALARALGDDAGDELAGESVATIYARCLERAHELGAPADPFGGVLHPKVREWCGALMAYAEERMTVVAPREDKSSEAERWRQYAVYGCVRDSSGRPCDHEFSPLGPICHRPYCHVHIDDVWVDPHCSHKFVDSKHCLLCGVSANVLHAKARRELELFQVENGDAASAARAKAESINEEIGAAPGSVDAHEWEDIKRAGECGEPNRLAPPATAAIGAEPLVSFAAVEELSTERRQNAEQWAQTKGSRGRLPPA